MNSRTSSTTWVGQLSRTAGRVATPKLCKVLTPSAWNFLRVRLTLNLKKTPAILNVDGWAPFRRGNKKGNVKNKDRHHWLLKVIAWLYSVKVNSSSESHVGYTPFVGFLLKSHGVVLFFKVHLLVASRAVNPVPSVAG